MNTQTRKQSRRGRDRVEIGGKVYERKQRDQESTAGRLGVNPDLLDMDNFAYRWVNDEKNGRMQFMDQRKGWELVPNAGVKEDSTDLGNMVSAYVGREPNGEPKRAYLMRKPRMFFEDDQADKVAALDEQLNQLRRGNDRDGAAQSDYVPDVGISIRSGRSI